MDPQQQPHQPEGQAAEDKEKGAIQVQSRPRSRR
jgi:hypothetical protein